MPNILRCIYIRSFVSTCPGVDCRFRVRLRLHLEALTYSLDRVHKQAVRAVTLSQFFLRFRMFTASIFKYLSLLALCYKPEGRRFDSR
jgi:hypothetical protein